MVKPAYTIAMAAIIVAAVFAGVVLIDDEADAADSYEVVYKVGDVSYTASVAAGEDGKATFALLGFGTEGSVLEGVTEPKNFIGWSADNGITILAPGSSQTISGDVTYVAQVQAYTVTFIGPDGVTVLGTETIPVSAEDKTVTAPLIEDDTHEFAGWFEAGGEEPVITDDGGEYTVTKSVTLYAKQVYIISFVVEGTTIATIGVNATDSIPDVLTKDNYSFAGWADAQGTTVYTWNSDSEEYIIKSGYEFTQDTVLTAQFTPDNMTVTLMIGDVVYGAPATVLYGNVMNAPALPLGYAYWAVMTKEAVIGDDGEVIEPAEYTEFNFDTAIIADMTLYAIPEEDVPDESIYATFNIEGTIYGPYKVTDRFSIPQTDREGYNFIGWTIQGGDGTLLTSTQVQNYQYTEDVTFVANYEVAEPPAPEEPAFYETTTGQVAIVIIVFVLLFFGYAVYSNMGGLKDKLFGYTISKKEKKE